MIKEKCIYCGLDMLCDPDELPICDNCNALIPEENVILFEPEWDDETCYIIEREN